ncbi:MAG: glycosyltransferase [Oscillospiraceae bacterium]|nr:glycosyltransferase [Oscillospiraceae bacterium]
MKKLLFAIYSLGYGGAERSLVNLLQELPEEKYQIDLLLFQKKGDFIKQLPPSVRVLDTPKVLGGLYASVRNSGKYVFTKVVGTACARIARQTKKSRSAFRWRHFYKNRIESLPEHYDVAVAYVGSEVMYFVRDKVKADRKAVWIHNDYRTAGYSKEDDYPYFAEMDAIVSVSKECVDVLREEFPEFQEKMHHIDNITSSALIRKRAEAFVPEEYESGKHNILSVGRLWPQKGFDMAVDAAQILKNRGLSFRWFIIGEGFLRENLEKQIKNAALENHVILLGTRNNPYPYIRNCSVLVQTSRYEGKSVVLDEGKILCAPIVTTAYPTAADQIIDGREGLVTEMSPEGIAQGIMEMLAEEDRRRQIQDYLNSQEYGNQCEVKKYCRILDE